MARALTSESRRLYSWWWDSHISPKNSKWLQENLTEMDTKVTSMIKLIEIDADSFARRAEMYYKKRPELMKLVEEFYRTYRALAERYDYATGELRHAQKTLQAAFPDQEPFTLFEDSSSSTDFDAIKHEAAFGSQMLEDDDEYEFERLKEEAKMFAEQAVKAEMEVEKLKTALLELTNEKEVLRGLYEDCLEKSCALELDHLSAQSDVQRLTTEILNSTRKVQQVEEICVRLETSNQPLKIELSKKNDELVGLKQMNERLEKEVALHSGQCAVMQKEIFDLKEEITKLTRLNPESFGSSVKSLQDENSRLSTDLQSSIASFHAEKSALVHQKTILENSLSAANIELEKLRERSKGLEELCELVNDEKKSNHLKESVQKRLEVLENRFMQFEKEKETGNSRILELVSSTVGKQEHESRMMMNQKRLDDLESKLKKQELQEELDKAVIVEFENLILHKYVKEVEEENHCLSVEIKKHIEASKLAYKLISELETEILEQQVEEELLLVDVENFRKGIHQVLLSIGVGSKSKSKSNPAKISVEEIVANIKCLKHSLLKEEDDKQRVVIENIVISTVLMDKYETMKNDFLNVKKENIDLMEANEKLGLELVMLDEEIEARDYVQKILATKLQERENELKVSDAEAEKLVFDLQVSNTCGIVFESKVHELVEVCVSLEGKSAAKDWEIEEIKRKASVMQREIEGFKAQLLAYTPVIGSLKENISSLEHNVFTLANLVVSNNRKTEVPDSTHCPKPHEPNGISDLIELQTRIAALEKVIVKDINAVARRKTSGINIKPKPAKTETEESKSNDHQKRCKEDMLRGKRYLTLDNLNIPKARPEFLEMRDIPLDQASDGSSSAKSRSRSRIGYLRSDNMLLEQVQKTHKSKKLPYEPQVEDTSVYKLQASNRESKKGKLLQRLVSDANKLANLESTVKDLSKRLESVKKSRKPNGVDFKIVKEQLEEAEETILQLTNVNIESSANGEKNASLAAWLEQDDTWTRSERIKTVQQDVENIQCVLMKLDDERKSKGKGRFSMSKSRTSVVLSDFIHRGGRSRRRCLCGCFTRSRSKNDSVKS